jgi:hypothetical protein
VAEHKSEGNVLVEKLGQAYQGIKRGPSRGMWLVIGLVVLAVVVGLTWWYFRRSARETNSERWVRLDDALFESQIKGLAEDKKLKDTTQGRLARMEYARALLHAGLNAQAQKHPDARKPIEEAVKLFEGLAKEKWPVALLKAQAWEGVAKGREALGEIDGAKQAYEQIKKEVPNTVAAEDADKQIARLSPPEGSQARRELEAVTKEYAGATGE